MITDRITEECMKCQLLDPVAEMTTLYHEQEVVCRDIAVSCKNEGMCTYFKEKSREEKHVCNIGDILYGVYLRPLQVKPMQVREITAMTNDTFYHTKENGVGFRASMIGKTVFLTEDEAAEKLKELQNNDTIDTAQK